MKIEKSNPLNRLYKFWITLGGKPTYAGMRKNYFGDPEPDVTSDYSDNLCHFMRVCMCWVWFRWMFCVRDLVPQSKAYMNTSPFWLIMIGEAIIALTLLMWFHPSVFYVFAGATTFLALACLFVYVFDETKRGRRWRKVQLEKARIRGLWYDKKLEPWTQTWDTFRWWVYAKKTRVCPTIEVKR